VKGPAAPRGIVRIAVVTTSWPSGEDDPDGHFVRAHVRRLEREGHTVTVISPPKGGAFGAPGVVARVRARPARALDAARWTLEARRRVARLSIDRVIAHWSVPCGWPIATASPAELALVSHGGDVRLLSALARPARLALVDRLAHRAVSWTFVSQALLDDLERTLDRPRRAAVERIARIEAMPLELPDVGEAVARRRRELGAARVAVCVARLVPSKRVDSAIAHAASAPDVDALVIVGDGPERPRLERLARRAAVDVTFVGAVDRRDALAWIGAADVLLHASEAEGLSTVIREAQAFGTRVVRVEGEARSRFQRIGFR
jgi:glycosyltransferase involved in cell wall biosynthesis